MKQKMLIVALATATASCIAAEVIQAPTFLKQEPQTGPGVMVREVPRLECFGAYYDYARDKLMVDTRQRIDCIELEKLAIKKINEDKKNANKK